MPNKSQSFLLSLLLSMVIAVFAAMNPVHADSLSQGMELYKAKKYKEAIPHLEKAAKEGSEDAIRALDEIYAKESPAVSVTDKDTEKKDKAKPAEKNGKAPAESKDGEKAGEQKTYYERATVAEDPAEAARRATMRKILFIGTAVIIAFIAIVQHLLVRRLKNQRLMEAQKKSASDQPPKDPPKAPPQK